MMEDKVLDRIEVKDSSQFSQCPDEIIVHQIESKEDAGHRRQRHEYSNPDLTPQTTAERVDASLACVIAAWFSNSV